MLCCPEKSRPSENKEKELLGYGSACDVWAMGVLAVELVAGRPPFERESRADTYECIMYRSPDLGALPLSEAARSFVSSALTKVPASWAGIQRFCITLCVDRSRQLHSVRQQVPTYL